MHRKHREALASLSFLLCSACVIAGNTTPPPGPIAPTGPTVGDLVEQADDVVAQMMMNPTEPAGALSMWVQGFPGSGDNDRIDLSNFSFLLSNPNGVDASGYATSFTLEQDDAFVPIALASLMDTHIQVVQIDQCITINDRLVCPVTVRLEDVVFTEISTSGDTGGAIAGQYNATMVAMEIEITYRTFRPNGTVESTYTARYDFSGNN